MNRQTFKCLALATVLAAFSIASPVAHAATGAEHLARGHTEFTSVVTKKAGALVVTTPNGAIHQLNENMARRHGQEPFKAGDEVIVVLNENNYIVDMHLKGKEGTHRQVTGKLIRVGRMKKQIKLQTPAGEQVFPLAEEGQKTKGMEEGELVTVELNEAGTVIDMHRADIGGGGH